MAIPKYENIIHRWKLDEPSGTRKDAVGTCHLTDNNTVGYSDSCKQGYYSADFELSNSEYLDATSASSADMNFTDSNFSISFWMKQESAANTMFFCRGLGSSDGWYIYYSGAGAAKEWFLRLFTSGAQTQVKSTDQDMGAILWHHLVMVRDGTTGYIYRNGVDKTSTSDTLVNAVTSARELHIGCYDNETQYFADGLMDDIIVWNVALSSAEVLALYNTYPISAEKGIPIIASRTSAMYKQLE